MSITRVIIKAVKIGVVCLAGYFVGSVAVDCAKKGKKAVEDAEQRKQNGDGKLYDFEFDLKPVGIKADDLNVRSARISGHTYEEAESKIVSESKNYGEEPVGPGIVVEPPINDGLVYGTPEEFYRWQATKDEPIPFKEKAKIFGKAAADELLTKDNVWSLICAFSIAASFFTGMEYGRLEMREDLLDKNREYQSQFGMTPDVATAVQWGAFACGASDDQNALEAGKAVAFGKHRDGSVFVTDLGPLDDADNGSRISWNISKN